jgi:nucleoside-diphosphate-sugar epimerase
LPGLKSKIRFWMSVNPEPSLGSSAVHGCKPLPEEDLEHVLSHTRQLWDEAKGSSFFITGGTGFFGMWLLESFAHINDGLGLGMRATILTRDPERFRQKAPHLAARRDLDFVTGDVRDFVLPAGEFRYVVHAATTSGGLVDDLEMLETIIDGTRRVLELAAARGARKFLYISSGAVYGKQPEDLPHVPEDYRGAPDPLDPRSAYGEGKRVGELFSVLESRKAGFGAKIARCFAFIGPHLPLDAHFAAGNFIRDALTGGPIKVNSDGKSVRSYLYASDLAVWLWTILFKGRPGIAYNVGADEGVSVADLARMIGKMEHVEVEIGSSDGSARNSRYVPCCALIKKTLCTPAALSLTDALRRTLAWHDDEKALNSESA